MKNLIAFELTSFFCRKTIVLVQDLEVVVVYFLSARGISLLEFMKKIRTCICRTKSMLEDSIVFFWCSL